MAAITRPDGEPPALVGADWNTECADRTWSGQSWDLYEPADPYAGIDWFADLIYQCQWDYDERGRRRHWADRQPGDVLWAGGLHDAAALIGADSHPTTGHHPDDVYGAHGVRRRIDGVRVTGPLAGDVTRRDAMQLLLYERRQRFQRHRVAVAPRDEELCDFLFLWRIHFD